jgi:transposase
MSNRALSLITLEFLPPYSPNLNLIEHLWKRVKVLAARYFPDAKSFQKAILDCLAQVYAQNELKSLMTLHFQLYPHAQFPAA